MTTPDQLDALAAAAMTASGAWHNSGFLRAFIDEDDAEVFSPEDAAFIAACDPATIRELLAAVREPDEQAAEIVRLRGLLKGELRECTDCRRTLPLGEFKRVKHRFAHRCRECQRPLDRKYKAEYFERNRQRELERARRRNATPEAKARDATRKAVAAGRLTKPTACEICGTSASLAGHHDDYAKPLDVRWLCRLCHENVHREMRNAE